MIILLTGKPGVGKSTVIEKFIALNKEPVEWVVTSAILRPERGDRGGFAATNSDGARRVISHKTDIQSRVVVGENHVDIGAVDAMFANALAQATTPDSKLTIVDEIGPIQLLSAAFIEALDSTFNSGANIVATIHYSDERLAKYRNTPNSLLLHVTADNRDMLPDALVAISKKLQTISRLSPVQQKTVKRLLHDYIERAKLLQVQKLMAHAIDYVQNNSVNQRGADSWAVTGRHGQHNVVSKDEALVCDCDLFNGRRQYTGRAGECSHIQAVRVLQGI